MPTRRTVLVAAAVSPVVATVGRVAAQDATPADVESQVAVIFGFADSVALMTDIYMPPARDTPRPAVIVIHPGGMTDGDRTWMSDVAQGLAEAGYVAFSIDYRLFRPGDGGNLWPVQLDDVQRAVRWVRANADKYGVDPDRIGAYGYSAGGQLAAFLGSLDTRDDSDADLVGISSRVACVVDVAGSVDQTEPSGDPDSDAIRDAILGGSPDAAAYRDFSPVTFVDTLTAPFLILQGQADSAFRIKVSRAFEVTLRDLGLEVVYGEFPGVDHFAWDWVHAGPWALSFLGQQLHPEG